MQRLIMILFGFCLVLMGCDGGSDSGSSDDSKEQSTDASYDGDYLVIFEADSAQRNSDLSFGRSDTMTASQEITIEDGKGTLKVETPFQNGMLNIDANFGVGEDGTITINEVTATHDGLGLSLTGTANAKIDKQGQVVGSFQFEDEDGNIVATGTLQGSEEDGGLRDPQALAIYNGTYRIAFKHERGDTHSCLIVQNGQIIQEFEHQATPLNGVLMADGSFQIFPDDNSPLQMKGSISQNGTVSGTYFSFTIDGIFTGRLDPECSPQDEVVALGEKAPDQGLGELGNQRTVLCYSFTSFYHSEGAMMTFINSMISLVNIASSSVYCRVTSGVDEECAGNTIPIIGDMVLEKFNTIDECLDSCKEHVIAHLDIGGCSGVIRD